MININKNLIAPCGMNCGICHAHLRENNKCAGCNNVPTIFHCQKCKIKFCKKRKGEFCFECESFPCEKLKNLDKRYVTKYEMSEIENLEFIRDHGIEKFMKNEQKRWECHNGKTEGTLCVHDKKCY